MSKEILGDTIQMLADEISDEFKISRCQAVSIIGRLLLHDNISPQLRIVKSDVEDVIKRFVLSNCLADTKYIFERK